MLLPLLPFGRKESYGVGKENKKKTYSEGKYYQAPYDVYMVCEIFVYDGGSKVFRVGESDCSMIDRSLGFFSALI